MVTLHDSVGVHTCTQSHSYYYMSTLLSGGTVPLDC